MRHVLGRETEICLTRYRTDERVATIVTNRADRMFYLGIWVDVATPKTGTAHTPFTER